MIQYGLIESKPDVRNWVMGGETQLPKLVLQPDRMWGPYLSVYEPQFIDFETYACVTFSALNCLEALIKRKYGKEVNFSDRFSAKASNTIVGSGNYLHVVAESLRVDGLVLETLYPHTSGMNSEIYYADLSDVLIKEGQKSLRVWKTGYEWVDWAGCDNDKLWEALQYAPLQVTVWAWEAPDANDVYSYIEKKTNHAVTLIGGEYGKIKTVYDHYDKKIKNLSWDFWIGSAMRHNIEMLMMKLIKGDKLPNVYAVDHEGKRHYVYNMPQLRKGALLNLWDSEENIDIKPQADVDAMPEAEPIIFGVI